jgi:hypothetical protein
MRGSRSKDQELGDVQTSVPERRVSAKSFASLKSFTEIWKHGCEQSGSRTTGFDTSLQPTTISTGSSSMKRRVSRHISWWIALVKQTSTCGRENSRLLRFLDDERRRCMRLDAADRAHRNIDTAVPMNERERNVLAGPGACASEGDSRGSRNEPSPIHCRRPRHPLSRMSGRLADERVNETPRASTIPEYPSRGPGAERL